MSQFQRDWALYLALVDMTGRNPDLPNIALPKMYSIIETKAPQIISALFGSRPYIPWESLREELKEIAEIQVTVLDELLNKAQMKLNGSLIVKMGLLYGTSFANVVPYFKKTETPALVTDEAGQQQMQPQTAFRLRFKIETWAPWEIYADPYAKGLAEPEECRFVDKIQLASKRQIREAFEAGAYPGFDIEQLDATPGDIGGQSYELDFGQQLLTDFGLPQPVNEDDMGILIRYESPDRYITTWQGEHVLAGDKNQKEGNPYAHGKINLSRFIHTIKPHTQEQFWGDGEARPNEVQIQMLNDSRNLLFQVWQMMAQPMMFFRKGHVDKQDLVYAFAQRVPVQTESNRPISDDFQVEAGRGLPPDYYLMVDRMERDVDLVARSFPPSRGEQTAQSQSTGTLGEVELLKSIGDESQELTIAMNEEIFLQDFGCKAASIFDQYKNFGDVADMIGEEDALRLFSADPLKLPGGCKFAFKGSDKVANQIRKQISMRSLAPLLERATRPGGFEKQLMEIHGFDQKEIDEALFSEEEMIENQQRELMLSLLSGQGSQKQLTQ